jgi:uncharacterized protein (DUF2141 family)
MRWPAVAALAACLEIRATLDAPGEARFAVFASATEWLTVPFRSGAARAGDDRTVTWRVDNLPPGDYAVFVWRDTNGNGEFDRRAGIFPLEPYAFSRDHRPRFGPPRWDAAKLAVGAGECTDVTLRVR